MKQQVALTRQALKTPRAAAVAGIIFSVLFTASIVLIRLALPEELSGTNTAAWLQGNTATVSLALTLVPFAGIAFLWFMGVVRDRLGTLEDQFFSTVFFGSGLLFLALLLLVSSDFTTWLILVFPAWVLAISIFILVVSLRGEEAEAEGVIGSNES